MNMKTETKPTNEQLLTRALWLAFSASSPVGMGFLHSETARGITEETIGNEADEPFKKNDGSLNIYTDYVAGRMMKTGFSVSKDGKLTIKPEVPRYDYQSWADKYANASQLIEEVEKSFQ